MGIGALMSVAFCAIGLAIIAQASGAIHLFGQALVPPFVEFVAGAVFLMAGIALGVRGLQTNAEATGDGDAGRSRTSGSGLQLSSLEDQLSFESMWFVVLLFSALVFVIDAGMIYQGRAGGDAAIVMFFITFAAVYWLYVATKKSLEKRKYGHVILELASTLVPGGLLSGRLVLEKRLPDDARITARFTCRRTVKVRVRERNADGEMEDRDRDVDTELWQAEQVLDPEWIGQRGWADVRQALPEHLPPGDYPVKGLREYDRPYHLWGLQVHARVPSIELDRTFLLDVSAPSAASAFVDFDASAASAQPATSETKTTTLASQAPTNAGPERIPLFAWLAIGVVVLGIGVVGFAAVKSFGQPADTQVATASRTTPAPTQSARTSAATQPRQRSGPLAADGILGPARNAKKFAIEVQGLSVQRAGDDLVVAIEDLRLRRLVAEDNLGYSKVGATLQRFPTSGGIANLGEWQHARGQGALAGASAVSLGAQRWRFQGQAAACASGECQLRFHVDEGSRDVVRNVTSPARQLPVRDTSVPVKLSWQDGQERALLLPND